VTEGSTGRASWVYRIAWTFYLVLAVGGLVWVGLQQGRIGHQVFVRVDAWWIDLAIGLAAGGVLILVWMVARQYLTTARRLESELAEMLGPLTTSEVVALALLSGFAEEMFFRGAMQSAWGWLPATIVFALLHAGPGPSFRIWTVFAAVAGLVLAGLMLWRGNLLAPVVAHVVVNGVNLGRLSRLSGSLDGALDATD
jgi:membrane protease YdiL (CAAX protease family)